MRWDLAAESIVVKLRWFGILMGYVLVQTRGGLHNPSAVRAFLALGAGYAALDTAFYRMGEVIFKRSPLFVSLMESVFIALLCYHDTGIASPFRWYYLLSLLCCAIRDRAPVAWWTFVFHVLSFAALASVLGYGQEGAAGWLLTVAIMAWATWGASALATLLRVTGASLERLNAELEQRVAERTDALRLSQARVIQQEKMAAFGLLAAGIAHEVGNPLAALSSLVQMLQRRKPDSYTAEKLELASRQLQRIQRTVRELVDYSRPASSAVVRVRLSDVVEEALGIAKYYQRTKSRVLRAEVDPLLPPIRGVRDHLSQVVLNLVLNAIDATEPEGCVEVQAAYADGGITLSVQDNGRGITLADRCRLFQPFFTTKPHGTGLGLFVCRQIVEEMGGTLTFESEPGAGSTFFVRLPAQAVLPSPLEYPPTRTQGSGKAGREEELAVVTDRGGAIS
ncbi:MAG: ATP-binding protein [Isosphaeraceae bacterium]|nr:ATP-binding protein [Isosphaeraceae bacterium]